VEAMFKSLKDRFSLGAGRGAIFLFLFNTFSILFIGEVLTNRIAASLGEAGQGNQWIIITYPASIIVSMIIGAAIFSRINKQRFFVAWAILGVISSVFLPLSTMSIASGILSIAIIGSLIGIGLPSLLAHFAHIVPVENRGTLGGSVLLLTTLAVPFVSIAMSGLNLMTSAIIFAVWRGWSLPLLFFTSRRNDQDATETTNLSFATVIRERPFILYFVVWLMFCAIDGFEWIILKRRSDEFRFALNVVEPLIAGFAAFVAGVLSDLVGRRRLLIFGFVSLGMAYATIGFAPQFWFSWILYFVIDGLTIGTLWVLFIVVLWGDLAHGRSEKHYSIGEIPFFLTRIIAILLAPLATLVPEYSAFSLAAFFLFVAVIPLFYAPETLPEKNIKDRELKQYIEKAKKTKEKLT